MNKVMIYIFLAVSLCVNMFFVAKYIQSEQIKKEAEIYQKQEASKVYFTEKLFSQDFKLKDYSSTKFTLEEKGKDIIKNAREFHSSPALVKGEAYDEYVCAGYLFELSSIMWDSSAPYMIGMMEQNSKTPADAWQLPYSYEYVGGEVLVDFTGDFSVDTKNYWESIDIEKLRDFFDISFSEKALFGDIGFLYKNTEFLEDLKIYKNSNSHIAKNIGISDFERKVSGSTDKTHREIFAEALSCDMNVFEKMKNLLINYEIFVDNKRVVFSGEAFHYLNSDNSLGEKMVFQDMSQIRFKDITLMHFFAGAKVESLFEMSCQGEFFPINVMSINPRFIEKM